MLLLGVAIYLLSSNFAFFAQASPSDKCETRRSCEKCIQEFDCDWCITLAETNVSEKIHCRLKTDDTEWCKLMMKLPYIEPQKITEDFSNHSDRPIQIKPQRVKLTLRRGEKYDLKFQYKRTENFPVDLYYIMDLSKSMKEHKSKLADLGNTLAEAMRNITTNFRLGFGGFIDKVDLPFVSTVQSTLANPPYSFKNHLSLTNDSQKFVNEVSAASLFGNLDSPEGGFDAIMQAMVCKEQIGWRQDAHHLLVFSTDAEFHIAGDGKLAGIIEPNPAECYTSDADYLIYDYPSVSQINYVAKKNAVNIIFAIVKKKNQEMRRAYQKLSSEGIENSNFGELDTTDSHNVIDLVVENYNKIVQTVKFTSNASKEVDVRFSSTCTHSIEGQCNDVHVGDILDFTATIEPRECPINRTQIITIHPQALDQSLVVELEILCDCPCSKEDHETYERQNEEFCNSQGDLKCGICDCYPGMFGTQCQCNNTVSTTEDTLNCRMKGTKELCSGLGECICGVCHCKSSDIYGPYCQYNKNACKKVNGLICSGKGSCDNNECVCQARYSGEACDCDESNVNCISPGSDLICSGHGTCNCGKCQCPTDKNKYLGKYCDECISCPSQRCVEHRHCVECKAYKTGKYNESACAECRLSVTVVDRLEGFDDPRVKKCRVLDENDCIINFEYYYEVNKYFARALKTKDCPTPPNVLAWILGVIGSILLAGIIMLLIWKVCTTIHDRREYAKFEKEREKLKWSTNKNPLFIEATSTFANPAYNRTSSRLSFKK